MCIANTNHMKVNYKICMQTKHWVYSNKQLCTIIKTKPQGENAKQNTDHSKQF